MDKLNSINRAIKALSDENRLRIMGLLDCRKDLCVCEITAIIGLSQPTISSHLKLLESAGLIDHKKEGLWVNYSISNHIEPGINAILAEVLQAIKKGKIIKDDMRKLSRIDRAKLCSRKKPG